MDTKNANRTDKVEIHFAKLVGFASLAILFAWSAIGYIGAGPMILDFVLTFRLVVAMAFGLAAIVELSDVVHAL